MTEERGRAFVDFVRISVKAGDGGQGCIAFIREKGKPFGGPSGGDGGRGGSVWLEADETMTTLLDFKLRPAWQAQRGEHGAGKQCSGKSGVDITLKAPLGTVVIDAETKAEIGDLTQPGQRLLLAKGGDGGRGNQHFATSTNKAPRKAEAGWPGEQKTLILELKIFADCGLVGLPNAGKSTLLAAVTKATPKIAAYPFTTLSPNLGVFVSADLQRQITLADIPGLIEGAHKGQGLGDRFLRHIERTKVLVHLVAAQAGTNEDGEMVEIDTRPEALQYAFELVENELAQYSDVLLKKPRVVVLSKTDLLTPDEVLQICEHFRRTRGIELLPISAHSGEGIPALLAKLEELTAPPPEPQPTAPAETPADA